jgi:hypothetical protein
LVVGTVEEVEEVAGMVEDVEEVEVAGEVGVGVVAVGAGLGVA